MVERARLSARPLFVVGTAYALFAACVSYWFTRATGLSLWTLRPDASANFAYILAMNLVVWSSWAIFAPLAFELARRHRFDRQGWRRALVVHLPASLLVTSAHIVLVATGRFVLQTLWGVEVSWQGNVYDAFFRTIDFELPVYWAFVGLQHALDYHREVRARELRAAQLETELVAAQLETLQQQLHPHFLFNTLHAISALVHRDPQKADEMVERLSDLLRLTLHKVGVQEVTLAEELEYLRAYLDIEQVHFGDRLQIDYRIAPGALDALVPNLILQPLAENAIRHGLEPRRENGRLTIEARSEGRRLVLIVRDTGRGMLERAPRAFSHGVGLTNTRARLERLYRGEGCLEIGANAGGGVVATVVMPYKVRGFDGSEGSRGSRFEGFDCRFEAFDSVESALAEPRPVDPRPVKPGSVKPGSVKPGPVEPGSVKPGPVEPGSVKPGPVEPGTAEPGTPEPRTLEPSNL